jgi:hypothetical protein
MQSVLEPAHTLPRVHKPLLESYDSGEECSFFHWMEVCKLVDEADLPLKAEEAIYSAEFEKALKETLSEVETATAYQDFAGNVV